MDSLSRLVIEPITEPIARQAAALLADAGLHGHKSAADAMLAATALTRRGQPPSSPPTRTI